MRQDILDKTLRDTILAFNKKRKYNDEMASDFQILLDNLPKGQVKNLFKNVICKEILEKYGIAE